MHDHRTRSGLLGLATACLLLAHAAAAGAEGEVTGFSWHPSLRITGLVDDNLYYQDGNGNGALGVWVAPRLELAYRGAGYGAGADLGVDFRHYKGEGSDELWRATGWGEVGLGRGFTLRVANAYVPQAVRLGRPEDDANNLVQSNRLDGDLSWRHELGGGRELALGVVATHFLSEDYPEVLPLSGGGFVLDPNFRPDYVQGLVFGELQSPLGERTEAYVRGQAAYRDFTEIGGGGGDNTNVSTVVGLRSRRIDGLLLEISGGGGAVLFDHATAWRALARAHARYRLDFGLSVWGTLSHLSSPDLIGDMTHQSTGEVGFEQRFGLATALDVRVFATRFDGAPLSSSANLFGAAEVRLRRQLSRTIQGAVVYRHWRNAGSFGFDDFDQNRVGIELGFRL